jgi:hypothetical protein
MSEGQYSMIHKIHLQNFIHWGICLNDLPINAIDRFLIYRIFEVVQFEKGLLNYEQDITSTFNLQTMSALHSQVLFLFVSIK